MPKIVVKPLDFVAGKLGAEVVEEPLGRIIKEVYNKDLRVIVIDPNLHPYKKRHLIAHGLAHHLFYRSRRTNNFFEENEDFFQKMKVKEMEKEAEVFAAYLLIPEEKLNALLQQDWVKESLDPIPELAEEFLVSPHFMRKRLQLWEMHKM